ncbi:MAG: hypothetical protein ABL867_06920 [Rickettsiales bacterium]
MSWQSNITGKAMSASDYVGKFISTNGHAQQTFPAMHRAAAAGGMYLGWKAFDKGRDLVFGNDQTSEGVFVDNKREDYPVIVRFLHHSIDWNPHSDAPSDQWKKVLYQTMPAIGAALGTVTGSMSIFHFNNRASGFAKAKNPKTILSIMQAENATQYAQAGWPIFFTSLFGGGSGASMLVFPYGIGLNTSFYLRNGAANNIANHSGGNLAPPKALVERIAKVPFYVKSAINSGGQVSKDWAKLFMARAVKPILPKSLNTPAKEEEAINTIHNTFQSVYDEHSKTLSGEPLIKAVSEKMHKIFGDPELTLNANGKVDLYGFDKYLHENLGQKLEDVSLGNSSWVARTFKEVTGKVGIGKDTTAEAFKKRLINQRDSLYASTERSM